MRLNCNLFCVSFFYLEIQNNDIENAQWQETLGTFWEQLPPINPTIVAAAMHYVIDYICGLEYKRKAILLESEELIV